jgi:DNA-binding NarL/FixJ family response regulator
MEKLKVLLADDHKIVREGLRMILEREPDIKVVAEAEDGETAIRLSEKFSPDLVLLDISMPGLNGIEVTQKLLQKQPDLAILILSMCAEKEFVIEALSAGAKGYLLKHCAATDLVVAIKSILAGGIHLSQRAAELIVKEYIQPDLVSSPDTKDRLSPREAEILRLIADGKNNKEIAYALELSTKTIETHRQNLMKKLDIHNIAGLVRYAIREQIIPIDK